MRAVRSLLNTPASRPKMLERAAASGADALILDLEDSVPLETKAEARVIARAYIASLHQEHVLYVRVNGIESGMLESDLDAVVVSGLTGIQLPKVGSAEEIRSVARMLAELETARGLPVGTVEIVASLETARGVWFAYEIASAPRVGSVLVGSAEDGDLQRELGYRYTGGGQELSYLRSRVLLAAKAAGISNPLDGVYPHFKNLEGLRADARSARDLGYRGKKAIHPDQVETINLAFTPDEREMEHYSRILAAFEQALKEGSASTSVDGQMIDYAMAETARQVLGWVQELNSRR